MDEPHLLLDQVHFRYGVEPVLEAFSLRVQAGEFVSLVGSSGSGKSTILKLLTGLLMPGSGTVRVMGAPPAPGLVPRMRRPGRRSPPGCRRKDD